jgi:hypothetical protein
LRADTVRAHPLPAVENSIPGLCSVPSLAASENVPEVSPHLMLVRKGRAAIEVNQGPDGGHGRARCPGFFLRPIALWCSERRVLVCAGGRSIGPSETKWDRSSPPRGTPDRAVRHLGDVDAEVADSILIRAGTASRRGTEDGREIGLADGVQERSRHIARSGVRRRRRQLVRGMVATASMTDGTSGRSASSPVASDGRGRSLPTFPLASASARELHGGVIGRAAISLLAADDPRSPARTCSRPRAVLGRAGKGALAIAGLYEQLGPKRIAPTAQDTRTTRKGAGSRRDKV